MKIKSLMKLTSDNVFKNGRHFMGSLFLCIIVLSACSVMLIFNYFATYLKNDIESVIKGDISNLYYFSIDDMDILMGENGKEKKCEKLINKLNTLEEIQAVGNYTYMSCTYACFVDLMQLQRKNYKKNEQKDIYVELIEMDLSTYDIFDFSLVKGAMPNEFDETEKDVQLLYLGYKYKDYVELGEMYDATDEGGPKYIVAGFFKKGERILLPEAIYINAYSAYATSSLDYAAVAIDRDFSGMKNMGFYYMVTDGYDIGRVYNDVAYLAEEYGIKNDILGMEQALAECKREKKTVNSYLLQIILVVGITSCIVLTCIQTMGIMNRKHDYGILYASGVSRRDILCTVILENIIKLAVAMIITFPISYFTGCYIYDTDINIKQLMMKALLLGVLPIIILISILIILISSILPVYTICKHSPSALIGGKNQ